MKDLFYPETRDIEATKERLKELVDLLMKHDPDAPEIKDLLEKHKKDYEFIRLAYVSIKLKRKNRDAIADAIKRSSSANSPQ